MDARRVGDAVSGGRRADLIKTAEWIPMLNSCLAVPEKPVQVWNGYWSGRGRARWFLSSQPGAVPNRTWSRAVAVGVLPVAQAAFDTRLAHDLHTVPLTTGQCPLDSWTTTYIRWDNGWVYCTYNWTVRAARGGIHTCRMPPPRRPSHRAGFFQVVSHH